MDANLLSSWNKTTAAIYKNVLLYSVAGACAALFGIIPLCGWIADIANVLLVVGFVAFYIRLKDLAALAEAADAAALERLTKGIVCVIVGEMLDNIPAVGGILGGIAIILGFILMLLAYNALKKSATFPNAEGMKTLSLALVLGVVGSIIGLIPLIGIVGKISGRGAYIMSLLGWKKVATPVA